MKRFAQPFPHVGPNLAKAGFRPKKLNEGKNAHRLNALSYSHSHRSSEQLESSHSAQAAKF